MESPDYREQIAIIARTSTLKQEKGLESPAGGARLCSGSWTLLRI